MSTAQLVFKRYETKYLLDAEQRAALEGVLAERMVPDEHGPSTVRNVYYDTPTALLARRSAEHPAYKEKIRTRCYGAPHPFDPVFVELKKKCDGVVYKRRCELAPADARGLLAGRGRPQTQIERELRGPRALCLPRLRPRRVLRRPRPRPARHHRLGAARTLGRRSPDRS